MKVSGILAEHGLHAMDHVSHIHSGHVIPRVWAIVADRGRACIWMKTEDGYRQIGEAISHGVDRPHGHHEYHMEGEFAEKLSDWLELALEENVFDRIVLVASPRMMGTFRDSLSSEVRACIAAEITKDLTHLGPHDLGKALEKLLVI